MCDSDDFDWNDAGPAGGEDGGSAEFSVGGCLFVVILAIAFIVFGFWFLGKYAIYT